MMPSNIVIRPKTVPANFITLTGYEMITGAMVGVMRHVQSITRGHKDGEFGGSWEEKRERNEKDTHWGADIEGALAEMAAGKFLKQYWSGSVGTFKDPDVGELQVRSTVYVEGHFIIREADSSEQFYVFVRGEAPTYEIVGWIQGKNAKLDKFFRPDKKDGDAWWVPADFITPF